MTDSVMNHRQLTRLRFSRPHRDPLEQGVLDLVEVRFHQYLSFAGVLVLDRKSVV